MIRLLRKKHSQRTPGKLPTRPLQAMFPVSLPQTELPVSLPQAELPVNPLQVMPPVNPLQAACPAAHPAPRAVLT